MKSINVVHCQLVKEKSLKYEFSMVNSPSTAANILREFIGEADREHFVIACLDTKNQITALHTVSIGVLDSALVHPREVFKAAILANARSIICCHNHPSGDPQPSGEDVALTKRLKDAGDIIGISIIDHIILGDSSYTSLKEKGVL